MSLFYLMVTLPLVENINQRLGYIYATMTGPTIVFLVASVSFIQVSREIALQILGWTGFLIFGLLYASPLAGLYSIIKTRNAESINIYITLASLANSSLWLTYGLVL